MTIPTRAEALEVLRTSREQVDALIARLDEKQISTRAALGGGEWSIKDLIGHLAVWEELATVALTGGKPRYAKGTFQNADEMNDAEIERKRDWTLARVRKDSERIRAKLIEAIENTSDEEWLTKVPTAKGNSARALVVGQILAGGRHWLFAHDLNHLHDLKRSVKKFTR